MLTYLDEQRIKQLIDDRISPLEKTVNATANNVDKILKIVSSDRQELIITKSKVTQHHKRLTKIERKLKLSVSTSSVLE